METLAFIAHDGAKLVISKFTARVQRTQTIVLLHANGFSGLCYKDMISSLDSSDVFAMDLRGHGASDKGSCSFCASAVQDVLEVVRHLRLHKPVVFGHSIGGTLAILAEQAHPGLWAAMCLYEPVLCGHSSLASSMIAYGEAQAQRASRRQRVFNNAQQAHNHLRRTAAFRSFTPVAIESYVAHCMIEHEGKLHLRCSIEHEVFRQGVKLAIQALAGMRRIQCQVALVIGHCTCHTGLVDDDSLLKQSATCIAAESMDRIMLHVLDGCCHLAPFTFPAQLQTVMQTLLHDNIHQPMHPLSHSTCLSRL